MSNNVMFSIHCGNGSNTISNDFTLEKKNITLEFFTEIRFEVLIIFVISSVKRWGYIIYPTFSLVCKFEESS